MINNDDHIFVNSGNQILRKLDNGSSWDTLSLSTKLLHIDKNNKIYAGAQGNIYVSGDNGNSWTSIVDSVLWDRTNSLTTNDSGHIYVTAHENYYISPYPDGDGAIFKSTDYGQNWNRIYYERPPGLFSVVFIDDIIIDKHDFLYCTINYQLLRSIDNGLSWPSIGNGLNVNTLISNDDGVLFAGTRYNGIFNSYDSGDSWNEINTGLNHLNVGLLSIDNQGYIYAGSGSGFYRSANSTFTSITLNSDDIPDKLQLYQNYPNPFNSTTTIPFELPQKSYVEITVFDVTGRKIKTLVSEEINRGVHETGWDGTNQVGNQISSGVYIYTLNVISMNNSFTQSTKMILLQ